MRKIRTQREIATMADLVPRIQTNKEVPSFDKYLVVDEMRMEMSESQEHLYFWYPKCVEVSDVIEYIIRPLYSS